MKNFRQVLKVFSQKPRIFIFAVAVLVVAVVAAASLGGSQKPALREQANSVSVGGVSPAYYDSARGETTSLKLKGAPVPWEPPASTELLPKDKKVIQRGSLDVLVKNASEAVDRITSLAESLGGFVENVSLYEVSEGVKAGSATIRVPDKEFTKAVDGVKKIATKVNKESVNTEDVTAQYVDLEAQLANFRVEERQYQEIMKKAVKIQDVLDVASRLAEVRGRIERTQGQINYLSRQVSMSTITVQLTSEAEVQVFGVVWRPLTVLKQSFKALLTDLAGFIDQLIRFIFKLPILILWVAVVFAVVLAGWRVFLWLKRKIFS